MKAMKEKKDEKKGKKEGISIQRDSSFDCGHSKSEVHSLKFLKSREFNSFLKTCRVQVIKSPGDSMTDRSCALH